MSDATKKDADIIELYVLLEVLMETGLHRRDNPSGLPLSERMGQVGVSQLMRDDGWDEIMREQ